MDSKLRPRLNVKEAIAASPYICNIAEISLCSGGVEASLQSTRLENGVVPVEEGEGEPIQFRNGIARKEAVDFWS